MCPDIWFSMVLGMEVRAGEHAQSNYSLFLCVGIPIMHALRGQRTTCRNRLSHQVDSGIKPRPSVLANTFTSWATLPTLKILPQKGSG